MEIIPEEWRRLSHRERRRYVNKQRRCCRRIRRAQKREAEEELLKSQPGYLEAVCVEERRLADQRRRDEARSMLENAAWLERERLAQEEFRRKRNIEEGKRKEKEERERLIREEWEALKRKEKEEKDLKEKEKMEKEERLKEALSVGDKPRMSGKEPWHNPIAPEGYEATPSDHANSRDYATEKDKQNCSFFLKTGACRFGDRCSRLHPRPTSGQTLMVPSMYSSLGLKEQMLNERDQDVALEHDDQEIYEHFCNFYNDVLPEFSKAGKVLQFKVSCNHEIHLRGNVYVQYATEEECRKAFQMFNGRWYAQKQLSVQFCPVTKWKNAICGLFSQKRCPKGRNCNFLHVFPDPHGSFFRADRDLRPLSFRRRSAHHSPARKRHYGGWDRHESRSTRSSRSRSGSRERSHRSSRRWKGERSRSRSGERSRYSYRDSRSRSRSVSMERSRYNHRRSHHRRSRSRSNSRQRFGRGRWGRARSESRSKSRSISRSHSRSTSTSSGEKHASWRHRKHKRKKKKKKHKRKKHHGGHHRRTGSPLSHAHQDSSPEEQSDEDVKNMQDGTENARQHSKADGKDRVAENAHRQLQGDGSTQARDDIKGSPEAQHEGSDIDESNGECDTMEIDDGSEPLPDTDSQVRKAEPVRSQQLRGTGRKDDDGRH